jgi:hypothetical protein
VDGAERAGVLADQYVMHNHVQTRMHCQFLVFALNRLRRNPLFEVMKSGASRSVDDNIAFALRRLGSRTPTHSRTTLRYVFHSLTELFAQLLRRL